MRDLLQHIRTLLSEDSALLLAFAEAGEEMVWVVAPDQRTQAGYPRIILEGEAGSQQSYGDGSTAPQVFDGRVTLEIVTRKSEQCQEPRATLETIRQRCSDFLIGDPVRDLAGLQGQRIPAVTIGVGSWSICEFSQSRPTRFLPTTEPTVCRHLTTFAVQLVRDI